MVPVSSPEAAEMVKLFENTFRSVNIGLANEAAADVRQAGAGCVGDARRGGHQAVRLYEVHPRSRAWRPLYPDRPALPVVEAQNAQYNARFIELASEINTAMPRYWVQKVQDALNEAGKAVKGSAILVLGVAYKKNVGDIRESPALDIIHLLQEKGAAVSYHDPHVPSVHYDGVELQSVPDVEAAVREADCVVITTDHSAYAWPRIYQLAQLLVDTRRTLPGRGPERFDPALPRDAACLVEALS